MKFLYVILIAAVVIALRIWVFRKRRSRRAAQDLAGGSAGAIGSVSTPGPDLPHTGGRVRSWPALEGSFGDVGLIAKREITERVRGRILRVGTLIILIAVGAAIVIPTLHSGGGQIGRAHV